MARGKPTTLTEAADQGRMLVVFQSEGVGSNTSRVVPYRDSYRDRTALMETPIEYLQRAAEDDEKRRVKWDQ